MKTSQQPTSQSGEDEWMSSLEAFRASLSVTPGDEEARRMTATSGRQCIAPSMKSSPLGLWLRTLLESSRWSSRARFLRWQVQPLFSTRLTTFEDDTSCERPLPCNASAETLKVTDMPSSRCLFRLVPSEPPHRRDRVFIVGHRTDIAQNTERIRREELGDIGIRGRWNFGAGSDARAQSERLHEVGQGRWRYDERGEFDFTVSPVHRGNDGLPFDVDRLTLSFGKWRTEALKAYGNAIVPQVMYEIFRAIEQVERGGEETFGAARAEPNHV